MRAIGVCDASRMNQDPATLDQLRVLLAIVEAGSFSAAGRKLARVQSAVSHAVASMEAQLGTPLFDRGARRPTLTPTGAAFVVLARELCARADALRRFAAGLREGDEPELSVVVDALFPDAALADTCAAFAERWPAVQLRLVTDTLGGVAARVREGTCAFGVVGDAADITGLRARHLGVIRMFPVVAASHRLAKGLATAEALTEEVQIVLSERHADTTPDQGVLSGRTWRVHDLHTKRTLLVRGLGWGNLPESLAAPDLAAGRLVRLHPDTWPRDGVRVGLRVVTRPDTVLGPSAAWTIESLAAACELSAGTMDAIETFRLTGAEAPG